MMTPRTVPIYVALLAVAATAALSPVPALAQSLAPTTDAPRLTLAVGGASINPLHGDDEDEGPVVFGAVGYRITRHLRVEGEFTRRTATRSYVTTDVFLYGGQTGIHGRADRSELGFDTTDVTVGANLMATTGGRTLAVYAGPGLVWHRERDRRYRRVTNCTPPIPSHGFECAEFDNTTVKTGAGLQLMAGVDLHLHRRVTVFVAGRAEYRRGLTYGGVGIMAGARIGLP